MELARNRLRPVRGQKFGAQWSSIALVSPRSAPWMREALGEVDSLARLGTGWDGGLSPPIAASVIELARKAVISAAQAEDAAAPHVAPIPGGGIQLEWHLLGKDLELEIHPSGELSFIAKAGECEVEGVLDLEKAADLVSLVVR